MNAILRTITTLFFAFSSAVAMADVAIIANPDTEVGDIDSNTIRNIFLGERTAFPNGVSANPVNHAEGSSDRKLFFSSVLSMSEQAHEKHWESKRRGTMRSVVTYRPDEVDTHIDMLYTIANSAGSIGYIDASKVDGSVKVLMTIRTRADGSAGTIVANR